MEPQERRRMVAGIVIAVVIVLLLGGVRAWLGPSGRWSTVAALVVVVVWGAWVFWSRGRGGD